MSFRVLVADPPWQFNDKLPGAKRGAEKHYPCMSLDDLCRFTIPEMADNSVLFMWRVASMVPEAYRVVSAWGFTPKTEIVWRKTTVSGARHFGMGRYVRAEHEACILAVRGRIPPKVRNVRSVFDAPVGRHSAKPEAFFEIVESLYDGPYAEMFARRHRPGWSCFGNEVEEKNEGL